MSRPFAATPEGLRLSVRVTPRASRNAIAGTAPDAGGRVFLKAMVTAAPEGGKANAAVIGLLSRACKIPRSSFEIAAGATARRKEILVRGDAEALTKTIGDWMERNDA